MNGEFTVHIHMAYPKVSNRFTLLPIEFDPAAEVKVTLLGSADAASFTVPEDAPTEGEGTHKVVFDIGPPASSPAQPVLQLKWLYVNSTLQKSRTKIIDVILNWQLYTCTL